MIVVGFYVEHFQWKEKLTGINFSGENLHKKDLTELLYEIPFNCLFSFYQLNFACGADIGIIWNIQRVSISGKRFPWRGDFRSDRENSCKLPYISKESNLR